MTDVEARDEDPVTLKREAECDVIVRQYRQIASEINRLFKALSERTQSEDWKVDGVGTCAASPYTFDDGMTGVTASRFPLLWQKDRRERLSREEVTLGGAFHRACPHHAKGSGCTLGDLKPARCLSYVEQEDEEIEYLLGMGASDLAELIRKALGTVMTGGTREPDPFVYPERNEDFVAQMVEMFKALTTRAESLPSTASGTPAGFEL